MMKFKHKNKGNGIVVLQDGTVLKPGDEAICEKRYEGRGVFVIEEIEEPKPKPTPVRRQKPIEGDDK